MVWMAGEDGKGAVDLLGQDQSGNLMRQGHGPEGKQKAGAFPGGIRPAAGGADDEDDVLSALVTADAEPRGKCFRSHGAAAAIKQDNNWRGAALAPGNPFKKHFFGSKDFRIAPRKGRTTFQVGMNLNVGEILWAWPRSGAARDVSESQLHPNRSIPYTDKRPNMQRMQPSATLAAS